MWIEGQILIGVRPFQIHYHITLTQFPSVCLTIKVSTKWNATISFFFVRAPDATCFIRCIQMSCQVLQCSSSYLFSIVSSTYRFNTTGFQSICTVAFAVFSNRFIENSLTVGQVSKWRTGNSLVERSTKRKTCYHQEKFTQLHNVVDHWDGSVVLHLVSF